MANGASQDDIIITEVITVTRVIAIADIAEDFPCTRHVLIYVIFTIAL